MCVRACASLCRVGGRLHASVRTGRCRPRAALRLTGGSHDSGPTPGPHPPSVHKCGLREFNLCVCVCLWRVSVSLITSVCVRVGRSRPCHQQGRPLSLHHKRYFHIRVL